MHHAPKKFVQMKVAGGIVGYEIDENGDAKLTFNEDDGVTSSVELHADDLADLAGHILVSLDSPF